MAGRQTVNVLTVLTTLVTVNLLATVICLSLAYGCWRLRQRLLRLEAQLNWWEQQLSVGLPVTTLQLTQGCYGVVRAQQQYGLWQQRQQQIVRLLQVLQQLRWVWQRF